MGVACCRRLLSFSGPSSDSDLISLLVDGDSLAELDDGMASGGSSPNHPAGGSRRDASPSRPELEPSRTSRAALFPSSLRKKDYLEKASEQIGLAVQKEVEQDFSAAFSYYRSGVDLLLQGVQGMNTDRFFFFTASQDTGHTYTPHLHHLYSQVFCFFVFSFLYSWP